MKYYIYRNPAFNKVGCTSDPSKRMVIQQGLSPWKDYVIAESDNEVEASHLEAYYKGFYKAKWDGDIYMNRINNNTMKTVINKTGTARFFGADWMPKNQFVAKCPNGVSFTVDNAPYAEFSYKEVQQLVNEDVLQNSRYNPGFYAVPEALLVARERYSEARMDVIGQNGNTGEHYDFPDASASGISSDLNVDATDINIRMIDTDFQLVRDWAKEKGLYKTGDAATQTMKLIEELGETCKAFLKPDGWISKQGKTKDEEVKDGLGDTLVVLINLSHLMGYPLESCLSLAYEEIKNRTGKMINGTFVKSE